MESQTVDPLLFGSTASPAFSSTTIILLIVLVGLLLISTLLSMIAKAVDEIGKSDQEEMKERGQARDVMALKLCKSYDSSMLSLLLAHRFVLAGILLVGFYLAAIWWGLWLPVIGFLIGVLLINIIICERIPQFLVESNPQKALLRLIIVAYFFTYLFKPIALFIQFLTKSFKPKNNSNGLSEDDMSDVIEIAEGGEDVQQETDMLKGIVRFGDLIVSDIMKSRMDIIAISITATIDEVVNTAKESGFSRIPVYDDTIDDIKGILYVKDLLPHIVSSGDADWQKWLRPSFFVHEHKSVSDLLRTFQNDKIHLSIVVDEYGGTAGLVTLEDIIEEIVGEISDEFDPADTYYEKLDENSYSFEGKTSLLDFCKVFGMTDDSIFDDIRGDSETIAGLILEVVGEIPEEGQEIEVQNFVFRIEKSDKRRIERVNVHIKENEDNEE